MNIFSKSKNIKDLLVKYSEITQVDEPQQTSSQISPPGPVRLEDQKKLVEVSTKGRQNLQQQNDKVPI
jgi:hypothetical protein